MTEETKVRLRIDTRQAQQSMQQLERQGQTTASKVAQRVRGSVWSATGGAFAGAAAGVAVSSLRGSSSSALEDVVGESLGGFGADLSEWLFGDTDDKARAMRAAREETAAAFGAIVGEGPVPASVDAYYQNLLSIRTREEIGQGKVKRELYGDAGSPEGLIDQLATKLAEEFAPLFKGVTDTIKTVTDFFG